MSNGEALHAALARLSAPERSGLARRMADRARRLGLALARPDGDRDIPLALTPETTDAATLRERARDAALLLSAAVRTAAWLLRDGPDSPRARPVFGLVGGLGREALARPEDARRIAIARVDWFVDEAGRHRALELNVTIPAMEAYADAAARAWIEETGALAGLAPEQVDRLVRRNGCIAEELRRSLTAHAQALGAPSDASIALVHRRDDPQLRELQALAAHFSARGHRARPVLADDVRLAPDGTARAGGEPFDVLYRHVFAHRIAPGSDLERIAREPARHRLLNPIDEHLEHKSLLAELSRAAQEGDAEPSFSDDERDALSRTLPWTRLLLPGAASGPDGRPEPDLPALVAAEPERFVLKRSGDYGGKGVLLGVSFGGAEGAREWRRAVTDAVAEPAGSWVVQEFVRSPRHERLVAGPDGEVRPVQVWADASTFTAARAEGDAGDLPGGSVVRFAASPVVNIVGGGGLAPLVRADVAAEIVAALARRPRAEAP